MKDVTLLIIILTFLVLAYLFYNKQTGSGNQTYSVPSELKGTAGLEYIKKNYGSGLSQARALCATQFKGEWKDTSNTVGCYNMQGFSTAYCNTDIIKNLVNLCNSIGGSSTCSSTQTSCSV